MPSHFHAASSTTSHAWSLDPPGPGHHFEPRRHEAHYAPTPTPIEDPALLPHFREGSAQCFPRPSFPSYPQRQPYPPQPYSSPTSGVGRGASSGAAQAAPSPQWSSRPRARDAAAEAPTSSAPQPAPEVTPGMRVLRGQDARPPSYADSDSKGREWTPPAEHWEEPGQPSQGGFGEAVYLSNDDTMSLSSAQRLIYAIDQYAPISPSEVRPHELLNYFSFDTAPVAADHDFSVLATATPTVDESGKVSLGLAIRGRPLSIHSRRNANLSFVVDRSGSMQADGRMDYVKRGLLRSLSELKAGDIVSITLFDSSVCTLAENFVVGRDSLYLLENLIRRIEPLGSTNLHDGLRAGYTAADRAYRPQYTNRVIIVTDAIANTGVVDEELISLVGKHYDARQIRLSGVGVGRTFNDSLLDRLTERGKGAYVFLGSDAEVDAVFGSRFVSLIETIASDVHFKLHLPPSLRMDTFYGEEASTTKERVAPIHYFAGTSQMFLSDLTARDGAFPANDDIMLTIEYTDPESGRARIEEFAWNLGEIRETGSNLRKAQLVSTFARRLQKLSVRPVPNVYREYAHSWVDPGADSECRAAQAELSRIAAPISADPEVARVQGLFQTFCDRYQPDVIAHRGLPPRTAWPDAPLRQNEFAPRESWPSANR